MVKILGFIVGVVGIVFGITAYIGGCSETKEQQLAERIKTLTEDAVHMRFRVVEIVKDATTVDLRFYDRSGIEIGESGTLRIQGTQLIIEYAMIEPSAGDRGDYVALPHRIYSETIPPENGVDLFPFYVDEGRPLIFGESENPLSKDDWEVLSGFIEAVDIGEDDRVNRIIYVNERKNRGLWGIREDRIYEVLSKTRGGIEIINAD